MTSRLPRKAAAMVALLGLALPCTGMAQSMDYGDVGGAGSGGEPAAASDGGRKDPRGSGRGARTGKRIDVEPYIEASQVVVAQIAPGDDVVTYSRLAAGIDASANGRNNAGSVSLRYERSFGWGKKAGNEDTVSGIARGYTRIAPGLQFDVGGLAARTSVESNGSAVLRPQRDDDQVTQIYSVYGGPSLATQVGDAAVSASYQAGYTKVEALDVIPATTSRPALDVFDDSFVQLGSVHAGVKPYDVLPVGLGVGANYYREDISNLDQRVESFQARADMTVPVNETVALVGGVGYEDVEISGRDVLRDADGDPVVAADGRYVTDKGQPRQMAYDTDGLIWDAGVIWRPSRRTALEAHVGRRYGSMSYYGTFAYAPTVRSSLNVSVYDSIAGFGGQLNRALIALPTEFRAVRNPLTGDIGGCVAALEGGNCLGGALSSVRSATFRSRGVMGTYSIDLGRIQTGVGAGYDRKRFIAAPGTILAAANGVIDENYWLMAYLEGRIDQDSGFKSDVYANWYQSGFAAIGDTSAYGASASYYRYLTRRITAVAALGIDGQERKQAELDDIWTASALVGVRYSF